MRLAVGPRAALRTPTIYRQPGNFGWGGTDGKRRRAVRAVRPRVADPARRTPGRRFVRDKREQPRLGGMLCVSCTCCYIPAPLRRRRASASRLAVDYPQCRSTSRGTRKSWHVVKQRRGREHLVRTPPGDVSGQARTALDRLETGNGADELCMGGSSPLAQGAQWHAPAATRTLMGSRLYSSPPSTPRIEGGGLGWAVPRRLERWRGRRAIRPPSRSTTCRQRPRGGYHT